MALFYKLSHEYEVNGTSVACCVDKLEMALKPVTYENEVSEYTFLGKVISAPDIKLLLVFQLSPGNAVLRYKYILSGSGDDRLTKLQGKDNIVYSSISVNSSFKRVKEVQFANYDTKF